MPDEHAILSPSAAGRWLVCPGSVRLAQQFPNESSSYAEEGTCAHVRGEIEVRHRLGMINEAQYVREINLWRADWQERIGLTEEQEEEMATHCVAYADLVEERAGRHPDTVVLLEQRVHPNVPSSWGTSDTVLVSPVHIEVIDLKYGQGVAVSATENPQLRLYGVGALEEFGDVLGEVEQVHYTVFQPRRDNISTETLTAVELRAWRDSIIPTAELALTDDAPLVPGEEQCRWCPAAGSCRAQLEWAFEDTDYDSSPDLLSNEEIAAVLHKVPGVLSWCNQVKQLALDRAYSKGERVPGFKVVASRGRRVVTDSEAAIQDLTLEGYSVDDISTRSLNGIGALEKYLGKEKFNLLVGPHIRKTEGAPALVPEDDKRPALDPNSAAAEEDWES